LAAESVPGPRGTCPDRYVVGVFLCVVAASGCDSTADPPSEPAPVPINGLLGIAFDPDYGVNRYVYVTYATRTDTGTFGTVARFTDVNNRGQDFTVLLDGVPSAPGHQIESLAFGPDGALIRAARDIQDCTGDPVESVQVLATVGGTYAARVVRANAVPPA